MLHALYGGPRCESSCERLSRQTFGSGGGFAFSCELRGSALTSESLGSQPPLLLRKRKSNNQHQMLHTGWLEAMEHLKLSRSTSGQAPSAFPKQALQGIPRMPVAQAHTHTRITSEKRGRSTQYIDAVLLSKCLWDIAVLDKQRKMPRPSAGLGKAPRGLLSKGSEQFSKTCVEAQ